MEPVVSPVSPATLLSPTRSGRHSAVRLLGSLFRFPARTWAAVRRRPLLTVAVAFLTVALTAGGVWRYAVSEWQTAQVALDNDRPEEARERLRFCLAVWPRSPEVGLRAARAARLAGDLSGAEAQLSRVLRLQDGATETVQIEFLLIRVQSGDVDEVAPTLIDAVEAGNEQGPLILETLARAYMLRLRYKMAWSCLARWIDFRPDEVKAYNWRAWVQERLSNPRAAMADYRRALELEPNLIPARLRMAEMLLEDKQAPEAIPHLERLVVLMPDDARVQARLGACRFLQGQLDEGRRLMERAAEQMPNDPPLTVALANLDLQEGHAAAAERRLRAFLLAEPSDTEALFVLSAALRLQGKAAESAAALRDHDQKTKLVERTNDLLTKVADSPTAAADDYAEIGRLLMEVGRGKLATYWLDRALERNPAHQAAHRSMMEYHERAGDAAQALVHRRQLRDPDPPPPPASRP